MAIQAVAGTVHNVMHGFLYVELDASLIDNDELLGKVAAHNAMQNEMSFGTFNESLTYLLPQVDTWIGFSGLET